MKTKRKTAKRSRAMVQVSEAHKQEIRKLATAADMPSRLVLSALIHYGLEQHAAGKVELNKPSLS
jgi:hypothetical protein